MQEIHIFIKGTVQGVGFRAVVKRHALLHGIKGFVRNLENGQVEICAQGNGTQINEFIQTIRDRPGMGVVLSLDTALKPMQKMFSSFEIY